MGQSVCFSIKPQPLVLTKYTLSLYQLPILERALSFAERRRLCVLIGMASSSIGMSASMSFFAQFLVR